MEKKKKSPSSLPSNYVSLAQLQERWFKQQNQSNLPQPQAEEEKPQQQQEEEPPMENHEQPPHQKVVALTNATDSKSGPLKYYRIKNRNDSKTRCRAVEVASVDHRKSEAGTGIGDENADQDGKVGDSKKNKNKKEKKQLKWKHKAKEEEERVASEEGTSTATAAQRNEEGQKTTIESELNDTKNGISIIVKDTEHRVRVLSIKPVNGKRNERLRKIDNHFPHHFQSHRNYYGGNGYGQQHSKVQMKRSDKMVWVRKDGSAGEIEI